MRDNNRPEDTTERRYWTHPKLSREQVDGKRVFFRVTIDEYPAKGLGTLRFRSREKDELVCIELRFNVPPPDNDYRGSWHETHGLPQKAVDSLQVSEDPDYDYVLNYPYNIRADPDQGTE